MFWLILLLGLIQFLPITYCSIGYGPKLDPFYLKKSQNKGSTFKLLCSIQEGSKPLSFKWYKNNHLLTSKQSNYRIESIKDDSLLVIDELTIDDTGNYSCSVSNNYGTDIQFTYLIVKGSFF